MTYTNEQFEKHKTVVEKSMSKYSSDIQRRLIQQLRHIWPTDDELATLIDQEKAKADQEVSADSAEIDEIMKYLR